MVESWLPSTAWFKTLTAVQQTEFLGHMTKAEQQKMVNALARDVYKHQHKQYTRGLRSAPSMSDIKGTGTAGEQLRHIRSVMNGRTYTAEGLRSVNSATARNFGFSGAYDPQRAGEAFRAADRVISEARKRGLPEPDRYRLVGEIYNQKGGSMDDKVTAALEKLGEESTAARSGFGSLHFGSKTIAR